MNDEKQSTFYLNNDIGLGSCLILLSYLIDRNKTFPSRLILRENNITASVFRDFIKIFKLTPEILSIDFQNLDKESFPRHDTLHFFSGYHYSDEICLFDKTYSNKAKRGKVVGICCYPPTLGSQNYKKHYDQSNFIFNRSMSMDYYKLLFEKLLNCGYDVVTLDQMISIEEKSYLISQVCDFVIGYEGGMMHLAHMLRTPTIILPRKIDNDLTNHMLHPCDSAWLLDDENIFLSWSNEEIEKIINYCNSGQGNNKFLTGEYKFCIDDSYNQWSVFNSKELEYIIDKGEHSSIFYPGYYDVKNFFLESCKKISNSKPIYFFSDVESKPVFRNSQVLIGFENCILTDNENANNLVIIDDINKFERLGDPDGDYRNKVVEIFKKNLSSRIIIRHDWSNLINIGWTAKIISDFISDYNLHAECYRIGFLGQDSIEMNILDKMLKKRGYSIHIGAYGEYILLHTPIYDLTAIQPVKKFSCFTRTHRKERLDFFSELIEKDLLKNFIYTYNNTYIYDEAINERYQSKEFLKSQVDKIFDPVREKIDNWIDDMPYGLSNTDDIYSVKQKFLFENLAKSYFNIVIESSQSFVDPEYIDGELIYQAMVTEKTYKAISCRRPFIIYSSMDALKYIKLRGYKTFHPYIKEDYDNIEDMIERRNAIIQEITRLNNLGETEFLETYNNCKDICEHNYQLFLKHSKVQTGTWFQRLGLNVEYPHYLNQLSAEDKQYALSMLGD